ncbi:hypothetical protein [Acidianus manzaensis]|uniref:Spore germination protein n=1 Tax=Acidianus manzaensis TaxID=282676 RepID=A0A1W6JWK2_9CREN|nr:hypothetical protein [Acidianus manzaensis]ARM74625.1 hypothetical protein B6F84_00355 [Acidianus manzaensis]
MNKEGLLLFSIVLTTLSPAILGTTHLSIYIVIPSLFLGFIIAYLTYLLVNVKWSEQGLYYYARETHPFLGYIFLISWLASYYLYVIYTAIYIPYYVLGIYGIDAILLSLTVIILAVICTLNSFLPLFFVIAFSQLLLILPIGWRASIGVVMPVQSLFTNILSSSLIVVCITLVTFIKSERKFSFLIPLGFLVSSIPLVYSSFLSYDQIAIYGEAIGNFGLIFAEFYMMRNLFLGFNKNIILFPLSLIAIILVLIGNIVNYSLFYIILIVPSLSLLYLSLFSSFISIFKFFSKFSIRLLGLISLLLFAYGDYSVISTTKGFLFLEAIFSIITVIIVGLALYMRNIRRISKD